MEEGLYLEFAIEAGDPDSSAMFGLQCICPLSLVQRRLSLLFLSWLLKFGLYTDSENISESRVCEAAAARRPSGPGQGRDPVGLHQGSSWLAEPAPPPRSLCTVTVGLSASALTAAAAESQKTRPVLFLFPWHFLLKQFTQFLLSMHSADTS